jgi:hypothetical protein
LGWRPLGQNNSFALGQNNNFALGQNNSFALRQNNNFALSTQPFLSHIRHHKIKDMKYLNIKIKY